MTKIKGWISTTVLTTILGISATAANAGIIVGNVVGDEPSVPCVDRTVKIDWGIIVGNIGGIIVGNLTGIIVGNALPDADTECGY